MSVTDSPQQKWLQIARVDTRGRILDVTDPNPKPEVYDPELEKYAPRYSLNFTQYSTETMKAILSHSHWVEVDDLRLLCYDLVNMRKGQKGDKGYAPIYQEYKGGPAGARNKFNLAADKLVSRFMSVAYAELDMGPVYTIRFVVKDGVKGKTGAIMPAKEGKEHLSCSMPIPVELARSLALTTLHHIQAKLAAGYLTHDWTAVPPE